MWLCLNYELLLSHLKLTQEVLDGFAKLLISLGRSHSLKDLDLCFQLLGFCRRCFRSSPILLEDVLRPLSDIPKLFNGAQLEDGIQKRGVDCFIRVEARVSRVQIDTELADFEAEVAGLPWHY